MKHVDVDQLIRKNLARLLRERGLQQNAVAKDVGVVPSVINDILGGRRPMGKDTMARLCRAMNVEPWEFYWTEKTPIVKDEQEQNKLYRFREEQKLGVAEQIEKYETFMISQARHQEKDTRAVKKPRVARHKRRAG